MGETGLCSKEEKDAEEEQEEVEGGLSEPAEGVEESNWKPAEG